MSHIRVNLLLLLKRSILISNIYFPFSGKCQSKFHYGQLQIILKGISGYWQLKYPSQSTFFFFPLSSRGVAPNPQSPFICSQRALLWRELIPLFILRWALNSALQSGLHFSKWGPPLRESSATNSWASMGQEQNNELPTWRFKGNFEGLDFFPGSW